MARATGGQIAALFRELKSVYRISDMPSGNLHATQAVLYSAVLTLMASRRLHRLVRKKLGVAIGRLPGDRWAQRFATVTSQLLSLLAMHQGHRRRGRDLLAFLCREAPDPNRSRKLLPDRAQDGKVAFA